MSKPAPAVAPEMDEGLTCPHCDYNLTGLAGERCPECGQPVDLAEVRAFHARESQRRGPAWERWPGYLKPLAFVVTTLQAALLPWRFARSVPARPRLGWALAFGGICFAGVPNPFFRGTADFEIFILVGGSMIVCLLVQSIVFARLAPPAGGGRPFRFWLAVGCYTSYPVLIEMNAGIPVFILFDESPIWPFSEWSHWVEFNWAATALFYLWWADLVVIMLLRCRQARWWRLLLAILLPLAFTITISHMAAEFMYVLERLV